MSIFNKIKKFIKNEDEEDDEDIFKKPTTGYTKPKVNNDENSSFNNEFIKNIFINGISDTKSVLTFDNVLNLCAIGFTDGTFKIFGKLGYEIPLKTYTKTMVKKLFFIINSPYIIIVTDSSIEKWDYERRKLNNILLYNSRITAVCYSVGLKHLFFSTEDSIIQSYNVHNNFLSSYQLCFSNDANATIIQDPVVDSKNSDIVPTCMKICPTNPNLLVVGYSNGLIIVWNLEIKRIEKRIDSFIEKGYCTSICWSRKGSKFVAGFLNGEIHLVKYQVSQHTHSVLIYKTQQSQPQQFYPIDSLEILYTNHSKKVVLFKGIFDGSSGSGGNRSLILIKGDNFKNPAHLSSVQVACDIGAYYPVTTLPYYNNSGNLLSVLLIDSADRLVEYKLESKSCLFLSNSIKYDDINFKSGTKCIGGVKVVFSKSYQCNSSTIELLYQLSSTHGNSEMAIRGGHDSFSVIKQPGFNQPSNYQLLINVLENNTIQFWNSTDPKNLFYLGNLVVPSSNGSNGNGGGCNIITLSFCPSTLLLSISTVDDDLLIYHISDFSKRIDKLLYQLPGTIVIDKSQPLETNIVEKQLPDAVFDVCKGMGKIKLQSNEKTTSIVMNPYKTCYSTRLLIGTDIGNVYHFIVSIINNRYTTNSSTNIDGTPIVSPIPSNQIVYSLSILYLGVCQTNNQDLSSSQSVSPSPIPTTQETSTPPQQQSQQQQDDIDKLTTTTSTLSLQQSQNKSITSMILCFYPIRDSDIDSSLLFIGNSNGNVMSLDLQTMKVLSSFKLSSSNSGGGSSDGSSVESLIFTNKRGDPISFLFFGSINHDDAESNEMLNEISNLSSNAKGTGDEFKSTTDDISLIVSNFKEISMYTVSFGPGKSIQHKRIASHGNGKSGQFANGSVYYTTNSSDGKPIIVACDVIKSTIELYSTINLDKIKSNNLLPTIRIPNLANIKFTVSNSYSSSFIFINNNNNNNGNGYSTLYCIAICATETQINTQYCSLFVDNYPMPPQPTPKNAAFLKLFSSTPSQQSMELSLDNKLSSEGIKIQTPHNINQQVFGVANLLQKAKQDLLLRGEKLDELAEKTSMLENQSKNFMKMAKQLNNK